MNLPQPTVDALIAVLEEKPSDDTRYFLEFLKRYQSKVIVIYWRPVDEQPMG